MKEHEKYPPVHISRAEGVYLYDKQGNRYYDTVSSWWCNLLGHGHPAITDALTEQHKRLDHVIFAGFTHDPAQKLAQKLIGLLPEHFSRIFFSDDGSTACEVAMKMSIAYWGLAGQEKKKRIVHLKHSYHGDTSGAMSVGGIDRFFDRFRPMFFSTVQVSAPYCFRCDYSLSPQTCQFECLQSLERVLEEQHEEIAALIIEPIIMAAGGMIIYAPEYLTRLDALLKRYNVHLIADEVATGFGRTGKMFAIQNSRCRPDFICLSKSLTGGTLPLAVTATTDEVYEAFYGESGRTFYHGHTYTANPLGCSVACTVLDLLQKERPLEKARQELIPFFHNLLDEFKDIPWVGEVRKAGVVGAMELVRNRKSRESFPASWQVSRFIYQEGLKHGLILRPMGPVLYFFLPLVFPTRDIRIVLEKTREILLSLPEHFPVSE